MEKDIAGLTPSQKKAGVAMSVSVEVDFRAKTITRDKVIL